MSEPDDLGTVKRRLTERGVNSRGWRLFLDYGYALFIPLGARWCDLVSMDVQGENEVAWLKILQACEMDILPPPELVQCIADFQIAGNRLDVIPPMFLRAAWKACVVAQYSDDGMDEFIQGEVKPLANWFFHSGAYKTTAVERLKAGWESLLRLRLESVAAEAKKLGADAWPPVVRRFESGAYRMVALCSERELQEEGEAMAHCVGSYAERCLMQPLRIFSVRYRKTGVRVATLSVLEEKPGAWKFDQLKGPANGEVGLSVWQESDTLLQVLNQVSRSDVKVRQFLDFVHSLAWEDVE
jgi:hypothetical protein